MQLPILSTPRLILRSLEDTDDAAIFSLRSDERVNRYIDRPEQTHIEQARLFIEKIRSNILENRSWYWAIAAANNNELIGTICIWNLSDDGKTAEIGYELNPASQGKGYMGEAVKAVIDFAFGAAGITTLEAFTHKDNLASTRLLQKYGFELQADRRDSENDNLIILALVKPG